MRQLLDSIDTSEVIGLRDRALLGLIGSPSPASVQSSRFREQDYF
jgi:hypothetical protein